VRRLDWDNCWVEVGLTGHWRKIHDEKLHPVYMVCCFLYNTYSLYPKIRGI
jgi:hypothetical protein